MTERILIVEANDSVAKELNAILSGAGYSLAWAVGKDEALIKIHEWGPGLIFVGTITPPEEKFQLLAEKRTDKTISGIPVIFVSSHGESDEINRALSLGINDYLITDNLGSNDILTMVALQLGKETGTLEEKKLVVSPLTLEKSGVGKKATLAGKTIMWVEDDKFLSDIIGRKLQAEKCTLLHAGTGEGAFRLLEQTTPNIILLDILLPGIDGFEILRHIKDHAETKDIPVILLSNLGQKEDMEKGKSLGASRFLVKAMVTLDEIVATIKEVLATVG